jgi:hypothetical protein
MNPKSYETLAGHRIDAVRREAAGTQLMARAERRQAGRPPIWRQLIDRLTSVRRRSPIDVARPGGDLRPSRRAELRKDVLDVGTRRLRRDPE